jgi:hypothetical protein
MLQVPNWLSSGFDLTRSTVLQGWMGLLRVSPAASWENQLLGQWYGLMKVT